MNKQIINSTLLIFFVIWGGTYTVIGPIRLIEVLSPFLLLYIIFRNKGLIIFNTISKFFFMLALLLSIHIIFTQNSNSLFTIRLISSMIVCITVYFFSISKKNFVLMPRYFLMFTIFLFYSEIYRYRWEYTYIFSIMFALLIYFRNYFFGLLTIFYMFVIGQRTSVLNIIYVIFGSFKFKKIKLKNIFYLISLFIIISISFKFIETRSLNAFKTFDYVKTYKTFSNNLKDAKYYTYEEFVFKQKNQIRKYSLENDQDFSLNIRLRKWTHAISNSSLRTIFFGLGSGYFGLAADSGWIRLLFEYGLIITFIFIFLIFFIFKKSNSIQKLIVGIFVISNIFLDIMFAPMLMGFTGLMLGLTKNINKKNKIFTRKLKIKL